MRKPRSEVIGLFIPLRTDKAIIKIAKGDNATKSESLSNVIMSVVNDKETLNLLTLSKVSRGKIPTKRVMFRITEKEQGKLKTYARKFCKKHKIKLNVALTCRAALNLFLSDAQKMVK